MDNTQPTPKATQQLGAAFKCPKCRNEQGHVRHVQFPKSMISKLLGREPGQFVFVTCTLCGFTETYDLSVYARLNGPSEVDREPEASSAQSA